MFRSDRSCVVHVPLKSSSSIHNQIVMDLRDTRSVFRSDSRIGARRPSGDPIRDRALVRVWRVRVRTAVWAVPVVILYERVVVLGSPFLVYCTVCFQKQGIATHRHRATRTKHGPTGTVHSCSAVRTASPFAIAWVPVPSAARALPSHDLWPCACVLPPRTEPQVRPAHVPAPHASQPGLPCLHSSRRTVLVPLPGKARPPAPQSPQPHACLAEPLSWPAAARTPARLARSAAQHEHLAVLYVTHARPSSP
jgi:hypothetical protein